MKIIFIAIVTLFSCISFADTKNIENYPTEPFQTKSGRWVYPKPLPVISSASDILSVNLAYSEEEFEFEHYLLFRLFGGLPVNVEYTSFECSPERTKIKETDEYHLKYKLYQHQEKELPKKPVAEIAELCFERLGYQHQLNELSMTIYPKHESALDQIEVPAFETGKFSFNNMDHFPVILNIMRKHEFGVIPVGFGIVSGSLPSEESMKKKENIESREFSFTFSGGSMRDYLIAACEACMVEHPEYFISFKFEPNGKSFRKRMVSKIKVLRNLIGE